MSRVLNEANWKALFCVLFFMHPILKVARAKLNFVFRKIDMGPNPFFRAIRFFGTDDGWVGNFTESGMDKKFPPYEN